MTKRITAVPRDIERISWSKTEREKGSENDGESKRKQRLTDSCKASETTALESPMAKWKAEGRRMAKTDI